MHKIKNSGKIFKNSLCEFKKSSSICMAGLLIALNIILGFVGQIRVSDTLEIRFDFLSIAIAGMILGPVMGMTVGGLSDILRTLIKGGAFFPGFTLNQMLIGFLFGMIFYYAIYSETKVSLLVKSIFSIAFITFVINLFITTYWLHIMYGNPYMPLLASRLLKEIILFPVNVFLTYGVLGSVSIAYQRLHKKA